MQRYSNNPRIKVMVLAAAMLVVPWRAMAQGGPCPLQPTQVKDTDSQLAIDFKNVSGKLVASYRFALTFFDHQGNAHAFPQPLTSTVRMAGHGRRTSAWQTALALRFLYPYAQAFLQQVRFADGSLWTDDGSHSCSVISVQE